jgi:hypothetical protein
MRSTGVRTVARATALTLTANRPTLNARAETIAEKPMFREAFKYRRAVIPASGWYEWQDREDGKQPWYFMPAKEPIALIAAQWETWKNPENARPPCICSFSSAIFAGSFSARFSCWISWSVISVPRIFCARVTLRVQRPWVA